MRIQPTLLVMGLAMATFGCSKEKDPKSCNCESETVLPSGMRVPAGTAVTPSFQFSETPYLATSSVSVEVIQARVDQANAFYFNIAQTLAAAEPTANFVFSPFSVQTAFSMLYPSTVPDEASGKEFVTALGFDADQAEFHAAMNGHLLAVEAAFASPPPNKTLTYALVNQVWTDEAFGLQAEYLDTIKKFYNSGVGILPLRNASEDSRTTINGFIAANTNDLITDLIPPDVINAQTAAVLTNSVYMLADWAAPFEKEATYAAPFANADGTTANPETMHATQTFDYTETSTFKALSMNYVGGKVAMLLVLPHAASGFDAFATDFAVEDYRAAVDGFAAAEVTVSLPKFTVEWGAGSLKDALKGLGMVETFEPTANHFPKLLTRDGAPVADATWIQDVFHKAKIIVDEQGTEAAAATAIVVDGEDSAADPAQIFAVDRPALFFIYEKAHKGIIFAGRLNRL